jgi:hypothetical protein
MTALCWESNWAWHLASMTAWKLAWTTVDGTELARAGSTAHCWEATRAVMMAHYWEPNWARHLASSWAWTMAEWTELRKAGSTGHY